MMRTGQGFRPRVAPWRPANPSTRIIASIRKRRACSSGSVTYEMQCPKRSIARGMEESIGRKPPSGTGLRRGWVRLLVGYISHYAAISRLCAWIFSPREFPVALPWRSANDGMWQCGVPAGEAHVFFPRRLALCTDMGQTGF